MVAGIYGFAAASGWLARRVSGFLGRAAFGRAAAGAALAVLLTPLLLDLGGGAWRFSTHPLFDPRYKVYRRAGLWLRAHLGPQERVAAIEVGEIAFFSERPMDDLLGLVTPRSLPYLRRRDLAGAFLAQPPEVFVYYSPLRGLIDPIRDAPWFKSGYEAAAHFEESGFDATLTLYRRRPGAALPAPASGREAK